MNFNVLKRVKTHAFVSFLGFGAVMAEGSKLANERQVAPWEVILILGGFLVMFAGALVMALVRWLNKVEKNVPRDPARMDQQVTGVVQQLAGIMAQLSAVGNQIADLRERIAHLEGFVENRR